MSAPDSEPPSMEGNAALQEEEGASPDVLLSAPPASIPSSAPTFPTTAKPSFTVEAVAEGKAVSVTSGECCAAVSSPAEASPAKPAETTTCDVTVRTSTPTSHMASASDSLVHMGTSLFNIPEPPPSTSPSPLASSESGSPDLEKDHPRVLTFNGVSVTLENHSVWTKFHGYGTEMILTKPGRRMFPYCRYRLSGLDPEQMYSLVLSIVPWDQHRYRWNKNQWEVSGPAENQFQGLLRMFPHDHSPCPGSKWMSNLVSFYKLKLTNNFQDGDGHILLNSMHRYIPRLHVIPVPEGNGPTTREPVVMGPESMTFTFPQTKFIAVTTYQNMRITQLKIYFNPFARGFREDGNNPRLQRISRDPDTVNEADATAQAPYEKPHEITTDEEQVIDLSMKSCRDSTSNVQETRLVPIMSNPVSKDEPYTPCMQGRFSLGELVLVEKSPPVEQKDEDDDAPVGRTPEPQRDSETWTTPKARSETPPSCASTPETSPGCRKRKKKISRRWASFQARERKTSPPAAHNSSLTTSMQPETDDVEGLLFISFTSKEALEVHIKDKPAANTPPATPPSTVMQSGETMEVKPETDGERIARLESVLLNDLRALKHRQVIHPVLQEVGLKLSSLDPAKSIDLQYLGVILPLPPPNHSEENLSARNKGLPFISRTGKTSDVTKIKGWKTKFMTSNEASTSNCEGLQRNLSAFCSNMLDEYLESEAQQITERAAAFSANNSEGSVTYQLPAKSACYVKTLDSALAHRNASSKSPVKADRPCPLSYKPLLYSALASPPPSLDGPENSGKARTWLKYKSESSHTRPASEAASTFSDSPQRSSSYGSGLRRKPAAGWINRRRMLPPRFFGLTKVQHRLLEMETEALNQGLTRTNLTPDRQSMALSALVTNQTEPGQTSKVLLKKPSVGSNCDKAHCRLGCICPGEALLNGDQVHCRKPECMFHCSCSRSDSTEQTAEGGNKRHTTPVSLTAVERVARPRPGSHTNTLWNRNIQGEDPEPLFTPRCSSSALKCSQEPPQTQPIQEHEKDPVYKYFESLMTCARVRGVGPRPPRQVLTQPQIDAICEPNTSSTTQAKKTSDSQAESDHGTRPPLTKQEEKAAQRNPFNEKDAKKQIQIQSLCPWQKDRKVILEALCTRMSQNRLSKRFHVGPYCINPIDKIFMRKPSGSIISYRLQITIRSKDSDDDNNDDEDVFAVGEEEEEQEDDVDVGEPERFMGVTPFLSGVTPAGRMRVKRKSLSCQQGLVQVNGKYYNHAKLMLGSVGSLHPANRLAAFVTGRLKVPQMFQKISQKTNSTHQPTAAKSLHIKAAGSVVSPVVPARRPSDLKTPTQPQGQLIQPNLSGKEPASSSQDSRVPSSVSSQQHIAAPLQSSSTSSPVSLTVSPSLKSPSFLEESGTYSFRICPPSNQSAGAQKLPGVSLPGGFTLIQLPKLGVEGAAPPQPAPPDAADQAGVDDAPQPVNRFSQLASAWLSAKTQDKIRSLLSNKSEPVSSSETVRDEPMPSDAGDAVEADKLAESHLSSPSEDLTSDSSDYSDCDEIGPVDVESVEEDSQSKAIAQMRENAVKNLQPSISVGQPVKSQRKNHTVVERARRHEQRMLFNKLGIVLRCQPKAARLTLLGQAFKEIQNLRRVSELLKQKKKMLAARQYVYLQKLSSLSGKSVAQIKNKLTEICARQKMEKAPNLRFFSKLLQSRAAQLETAASQSGPKPPQSDIPVIPAHDNIRKMLSMLQPNLYKALTDSYGKSNVPEPPEPGEVLDSFQAGEHRSKPEDKRDPSGATLGNVTVAKTLKWLRDQTDEAPTPPSASSVKTDNSSQQGSSMPVTLPLIRSKTGRIILPSCLKPLGNGYYTLMVMKSKDKDEAAASAPTDADQSKNGEKTQTVSVERESSSISDDKATSSDLNPKPSGTSNAPSQPAVPIQSPPAPSKAPEAQKKSKALLTDADMNQILAATRLTFNQLPENLQISVKRGVGRPAKRPAGTKAGRPPRPKKTEKKAEADGGVAETPTVAKRRGRPLKRRSEELPGSPVKRGVGRPPKLKQDDPESFVHCLRSPRAGGGAPNASRPLTRGALGKDFPSAKKRSWIDVEKELESDIESE